MVEKLINSNPVMYTLPIIREGVSQFILKLSTAQKFEETVGIKLVAPSDETVDNTKSEALSQAEALIQAKTALLA